MSSIRLADHVSESPFPSLMFLDGCQLQLQFSLVGTSDGRALEIMVTWTQKSLCYAH